MLKFLNKWKLDDAEKSRSLEQQYIAMVRMAAADGDLDTANADKLRSLVTQLGHTTQKVEADIGIVKQAAALVPTAAAAEQYRQHAKAMGLAWEENEKLKQDFLIAHTAKSNKLMSAKAAAQNSMAESNKAMAALAALQAAHPQLLGIDQKKPIRISGFVVVQDDWERIPALTNGARCWVIEQAERAACGAGLADVDLSTIDFVRPDWQDQAEHRKLVSRFQQLVKISGDAGLRHQHLVYLNSIDQRLREQSKEKARRLQAGEIDPQLLAVAE